MVSIPESIVSGTPILTNLIPTSSAYIAVNELGIAKENWTEWDIKMIVDNNEFYIQNCKIYRYKLTNAYFCERLIKISNT
jgi:1,2-diacylglycerol 3-alpha-glucosyltransferase